MVKAVIFDMDGVIIDSEGKYLEFQLEFAQKKNPNVRIEQLYREIYRPEVTEVLKTLKEKGYRLALASSTQLDLVERVLRENEIREYFEVVVSGSQFKRSKPNPEIYQYTASRLGVRTEECLAVEDSTIGITAASRAGMKIAAVIDNRYNFDQSLADYHIARVKEVLEVVKEA